MKEIVCRIYEDDKFAREHADYTVNLFSKEQYHYTFWDRNKRQLYQGGNFSKSAIDLARSNGVNCKIHHGSVLSMPFDNMLYNGIFCYALIHLLNKNERRNFLRSCFRQLESEGLMIFTVVSTDSGMFGNGKLLSKNRYEIMKGLNVFFYDSDTVIKEFAGFGLIEFKDIDEPIKHMTGEEPLKCKYVICRKE